MKSHRSPNKKPEEERSKNKERAELKREVQSLRRQLSRAQKQITKLLEVRGEVEIEEFPTELINLAGTHSTIPKCDECGSSKLTTITLPVGTLIVCKDCKHRKKA